MGRIARLLIASVVAALTVPALAHAEERTLTFTTAPISVPAYGVAQQALADAITRALAAEKAKPSPSPSPSGTSKPSSSSSPSPTG